MNDACKGCVYLKSAGHDKFCDYIGATGHMRPCPAGEACTVKSEEKVTAKKKTNKLSFDEAIAKELYSRGMSDKEIAAELGVRSQIISQWRYRRGMARNEPPVQSGTRPEVTVEVPEDAVPVKTPAPPQTVREFLSPVSISFECKGICVSLSAPNVEQAVQAAAYLQKLAADLAAAVSDLDTK